MRSEAARGPRTILLVEDSSSLRYLTREVLRGAGHNVLEAPDGEEALRVMQRHDGPIHLLLTDVVMPRMDGRTLALQLLEMRPELKVILFSGYVQDKTFLEDLPDGVVAFLQKPFPTRLLVQKVRELFDPSRAENAA